MDTYGVLSRISGLLRSVAEFRDWVNQCNTSLRLIIEYQCGEGVSMASKQRLASLIAHIKTLRTTRVGRTRGFGRLATPKVVWEDVETAFRNRISTGAVINVDYIDPRQFLAGARRMVLSRVTDAITEHLVWS